MSEYFDDGKVCFRVESRIDIYDCEEECDKDTKCHGSINNNREEDDLWDGGCSVFDLFGPVEIGELYRREGSVGEVTCVLLRRNLDSVS